MTLMTPKQREIMLTQELRLVHIFDEDLGVPVRIERRLRVHARIRELELVLAEETPKEREVEVGQFA